MISLYRTSHPPWSPAARHFSGVTPSKTRGCLRRDPDRAGSAARSETDGSLIAASPPFLSRPSFLFSIYLFSFIPSLCYGDKRKKIYRPKSRLQSPLFAEKAAERKRPVKSPFFLIYSFFPLGLLPCSAGREREAARSKRSGPLRCWVVGFTFSAAWAGRRGSRPSPC